VADKARADALADFCARTIHVEKALGEVFLGGEVRFIGTHDGKAGSDSAAFVDFAQLTVDWRLPPKPPRPPQRASSRNAPRCRAHAACKCCGLCPCRVLGLRACRVEGWGGQETGERRRDDVRDRRQLDRPVGRGGHLKSHPVPRVWRLASCGYQPPRCFLLFIHSKSRDLGRARPSCVKCAATSHLPDVG
jgi:hypothetical protein